MTGKRILAICGCVAALLLPTACLASPAAEPDPRLVPTQRDFLSTPPAGTYADLKTAATEFLQGRGSWAALCAAANAAPTPDAYVLHVRGLCLWSGGRRLEAVRPLVEATRLPGAPPETWLALAALYAEDGSAPEATGWLRRSLAWIDREDLKEWVAKPWFDPIRFRPAFREFLRAYILTRSDAGDEGTDVIGSPGEPLLRLSPVQRDRKDEATDPIRAPSVAP